MIAERSCHNCRFYYWVDSLLRGLEHRCILYGRLPLDRLEKGCEHWEPARRLNNRKWTTSI